MDFDTLYTTYTHTLRGKRKSVDALEFGFHLERNLVRLYNDVNRRELQPRPYTFISPYPKPREVFAADFGTKVIQQYIEEILRPEAERRLSPRIFNNRKGKGNVACINQVITDIYYASRGFTRDCWIIKVDMKGYFPNASQDIAYQHLCDMAKASCNGDELSEMEYLIAVNIYHRAAEYAYRKSARHLWEDIPAEKSLFSKPAGTGGAIGHLIWQLAMTYYMNDVVMWLSSFAKVSVYMDDITIVTDNKEMALSMIPELRRRLHNLGVTLHSHKFYCQHYTKGVEVVGRHIKMDRVYVNNRCVRRAFEKLRMFNQRASPSQAEKFVSCANSYLGIFKTCNGYSIVRRYIAAINPRWWDYIAYDDSRKCINVKPKYRRRNRIVQHYNLQRYYGSRKKNRREGKRGTRTEGVPR